MAGVLLLGSRRYSSWSLRGWLAVRLAGLDVTEEVIPLKGGGKTTEIHARSPNRMVPYLTHDGADVWESLAICEYCAEIASALWPEDRIVRAHARSISAQMHAGFRPIRQNCPMDVERVPAPLPEISEELAADVALLSRTLKGALLLSGQATPFLFAERMTVADCMYAPIAIRIHTFELDVDPVVKTWVRTMLDHPLMREWYELAEAEPAEWRLVY
ncbi:glutathione S-transferase family protein [Gluconobacter oxydans]|uniref:glutathione S-transferase family protein n=1 Tax=Gluconobacter oxydans TaxID=442 RepID=UPI002647237D|nr:glutathione S-transferase family protein [Gluconobacter oxydans]WKE47635.1 glutathione S-transferase family protein [Gluconobacter oxydans]